MNTIQILDGDYTYVDNEMLLQVITDTWSSEDGHYVIKLDSDCRIILSLDGEPLLDDYIQFVYLQPGVVQSTDFSLDSCVLQREDGSPAGEITSFYHEASDEDASGRLIMEINLADNSKTIAFKKQEKVVKEESTTKAEPAKIPVLTYGRLPFDTMEKVAAGDDNPDGGYAHEYRTGDGMETVFSCAYLSMREESEEAENLEDYITGCAEDLTIYETRDIRAEKNETYSEKLGCPVYIVQFTTGRNEDTRFWTVFGTEANGYIYLYAFDIWADADWEQERVWEVFDELTFSD